MSASRPNPALETVTLPRVELATNQALLALADRALGLAMRGAPSIEPDLLDLDRVFIQARAAIRNEIDSRPARYAPVPIMRRPGRQRRATIGGIAP